MADSESLRKQLAALQAMLAMSTASPPPQRPPRFSAPKNPDPLPPPDLSTTEELPASDDDTEPMDASGSTKSKVNTYYVSFTYTEKLFQDNCKTDESAKIAFTKHLNKLFSCVIGKTDWGNNTFTTFTANGMYGGQFKLQKKAHKNSMLTMSKVTLTTKLAKITRDRTGEYFTLPEYCQMNMNTAYNQLAADDQDMDDDYASLAKRLVAASKRKEK